MFFILSFATRENKATSRSLLIVSDITHEAWGTCLVGDIVTLIMYVAHYHSVVSGVWRGMGWVHFSMCLFQYTSISGALPRYMSLSVFNDVHFRICNVTRVWYVPKRIMYRNDPHRTDLYRWWICSSWTVLLKIVVIVWLASHIIAHR